MTSVENFNFLDSYFERLMNQYDKKIRLHALKLTKNYTDAEDLYQDTALRIYVNMDKMTDESKFYNWVLRIMHNIFLDIKRKESRRPKTTSFEDVNLQNDCEVEYHDKNVDIESEVMLETVKKLTSLQMRNMISELNPIYSEALALNTYATSNPLDFANSTDDGMGYAEVASNINTNTGTVRSRLNRAKTLLKASIENHNYSPE